MNLVIRSEAHLDIAEGIAYYLEEESPVSAERFTEAIEIALTEIERSPFLLREIEDGVRAKMLRKFPYSILYKVAGSDMLVYAIKHHSREDGYWQHRK